MILFVRAASFEWSPKLTLVILMELFLNFQNWWFWVHSRMCNIWFIGYSTLSWMDCWPAGMKLFLSLPKVGIFNLYFYRILFFACLSELRDCNYANLTWWESMHCSIRKIYLCMPHLLWSVKYFCLFAFDSCEKAT